MLNKVSTGKTHRVNQTGPPVFDVNTKAALGMVHSGTGQTQITNFMSALEIEGMHHTTMKMREKEVEPCIQAVANQTCRDALLEEIKVQQSEDRISDENKAQGQFKYDMGWQKRGSGRTYDSRSGVGTLIGNQTGKICSYGIRNKDCRKCNIYHNKGEQPPSHDCSRNWFGSSKSMESSVAVQTIEAVEKENVHASVLVMDDDTTTMAKVTNIHPITKWSDMNHIKKNLGNSLHHLAKSYNQLTTKVIQYFQKCFSYAVKQNQNNADGLRQALSQIVPHSFGDHSNCDRQWCGYNVTPDTYKHKSLPHGRDLSGDNLKNDLVSIFNNLCDNVDKIAPCGSTKDVESFHNIISSKAPKRIHYSSTSSLQNRVNCAVAEKNIGTGYVNKVNELIGVSPGRIFKIHAERKDKTRKRRLTYENTKAFKKNKLERKLKQKSVTAQCELREGITYQSCIDLTTAQNDSSIEIPPPRILPEVVSLECNTCSNFIFCDIETTSLSKSCDIVQIAAMSGNDIFSKYIMPSQAISSHASDVTGLVMHGNTLFLKGQPVKTDSLCNVLTVFLDWLDVRKPSILIGHNFKTFDFPRILRAFENCHLLAPFKECVVGIVDTLPLMKEVYPDLESYSQENLVSKLLNQTYSAHNALEDVSSLQTLISHSDPDFCLFSKHSASTSSMVDLFFFNKETDRNLESLSVLYESNCISKNICRKIAQSGLRLEHLKISFIRGGLSKLLSEKTLNGKARVTNNGRIIQSIKEFLSHM